MLIRSLCQPKQLCEPKILRFTALGTKNYPDPLGEIKYDKNKTDILYLPNYKMTSNRIPPSPTFSNGKLQEKPFYYLF